MQGDSTLVLKAGEWVEVRSKEEILSTLDERGSLDGLPFMPEMLACCGKRFRVYKRADKTCDPAHSPWSIRRVRNSVHLEGVRCNGDEHGGCEADCLIFWNENWLKRITDGVVVGESLQKAQTFSAPDGNSTLLGIERIIASTRSKDKEGQTAYSCQATELRNFASEMAWWDPRQYIRDLRSGNLRSNLAGDSHTERALEFTLSLILVLRAFILSYFREYRRLNYPLVAGALERSPIEKLDLQPGELVQVRSKEEILATLDKTQRTRGLWFDGEMLPYCGGIYRVLRRVRRIIDEKNGKMVEMKFPCIVLGGVVCKSDFNRFCPRAIYPYWREEWLKRVSYTHAAQSEGQNVEFCEER